MVSKKARVLPKKLSLLDYAKTLSDQVVLLDDLLENGKDAAHVYPMAEFITAKNKLTISPEQLVFKEKAGTLVNDKGRKIVEW